MESQFTEARNLEALQQVVADVPVGEVCRRRGAGTKTHFR